MGAGGFDPAGVGVVSSLLRELRLPAALLSPLLAHAGSVLGSNASLGLIARGDEDAILLRHTADSLLPALASPPRVGQSWVDVGSGAGFPGLVLAICYPESSFTLVEPQRKRAGFLELQRDALGLDNVEVYAGKAQELNRTFDVAVARALAEPRLAIELMRGSIRRGGTILVAVGPTVQAPPDALALDLSTPGVDSPGRVLMIAESITGA